MIHNSISLSLFLLDAPVIIINEIENVQTINKTISAMTYSLGSSRSDCNNYNFLFYNFCLLSDE